MTEKKIPRGKYLSMIRDVENHKVEVIYQNGGLFKYEFKHDLFTIKWSLSGPIIIRTVTWESIPEQIENLPQTISRSMSFTEAQNIVVGWYRMRAHTINELTEETYFDLNKGADKQEDFETYKRTEANVDQASMEFI
jgi:hypothetical protein